MAAYATTRPLPASRSIQNESPGCARLPFRVGAACLVSRACALAVYVASWPSSPGFSRVRRKPSERLAPSRS